jgi:hypothetical protein
MALREPIAALEVRCAIDLALELDRVVESDGESGGTPSRLGPVG